MIRVTGDDDGVLDETAVERAIRTHLTGDPDPTRPICTAASALLVFDRADRIAPCEFSAETVELRAGDDPWLHPDLSSLRTAHEHRELPARFCAGCIWRIREGEAGRCPMVREYAAVPVSDRRGARTIVVRLGPRAGGVGARVAPLLALEPESLVVEGVDPFASDEFSVLVEALARLDPGARPSLEVRANHWPPADASFAFLGDVGVARARVRWSAGFESALESALAVVGERDCVEGELAFGPTTWANIHTAAVVAAERGVSCRLSVDPELVALPLREQQFVVHRLAREWEQFAGDQRPGSLGESAYTALLADARAAIRAAAVSDTQDPAALLEGAGAGLAWPSLDDPILTDAARGAELCCAAFELRGAASLRNWVESQDAAALERAAAERTWIRLLLLSVVCDGRHEPAARCLRAVYADEKRRRSSIDADLECAEAHAARSWVESFHERLGLHRWKQRRAPFAVRRPAAPPEPLAPDVTVLIPSYRHEDYIVAAIRSVLAQTYGNFDLLVVDDRSPDRTVELARSIEDPRLRVRVNDENLGLGNSVLTALADCRTPFVALLNSDDLFHQDRLERCRQELLDRPTAQVVATGLYIVDAENGRLTTGNTGRLRDGEEVFDWTGWYANALPSTVDPAAMFAELLSGNFLATSSNLFCRTDFLRSQAAELRQLKYCLDWQLFLEAARTEALVYLPARLASYRLHAANTVWFHEGRRWSYYLEVNRVVSGMLSKFAVERGEDYDSEVLRLLVDRVVDNPEIDGFALFVNHLLGGADLEHLSETDTTVEALVARLNARTEVLSRASYALRELGRDDVDFGDLRYLPELRVDHVLGEIQSDELRSLRGANAWLNEEQNDLKRELQKLRFDLRDTSDRADRELDRMSELLTKLSVGLRKVDDEFAPTPPAGAHQDLLSRFAAELTRLFELEWRLNRQIEMAQHLESERQRLEKDVAAAWAQHESSQDTLYSERAARDAERQAHAARIAATESELEHARAVHARLAREHDELQVVHEQLTVHRHHLQGELTHTVQALAATRVAWRDEIQRIHATREWRTGRFLWQKLPLVAKTTRLAVRVRKFGADWWARKQLARRERRRGSAMQVVACATSSFPNYSHTFVYQELMSMHERLGAEITLLYRHDADTSHLPAAFRYLDERKVRVEASPEVSERDLAHFRATRPDRVESLLAALARAGGKSRAELESSHELLSAFTFARRIEVLAPNYIHTYFFYDQSLNGLVASWLLDIPRGVSAYADHMMDDWPLKVVPLHLENASIVVATSRRIERELCEIAGEAWASEHAAKIVVKPNGVDGRRFPYQERPPRSDDCLELVSISRIEPKKGLLELVDVVARLRDRGRRVRVHVVGSVDPPTPQNLAYGETLQRAIEDRGLDSSFILHGFLSQEDTRPLLGSVQGFIAPYVETESGDKDGIPTAMLEAMSSGIPVVATDAGSITEVVDDGVEGFLAPQRDPEALADAIERMFCDVDRLRELGRAARARFEREFDTAVTEARLHDRIRSVVDRAKSES